jgi:PAS domain S-box-containing protein
MASRGEMRPAAGPGARAGEENRTRTTAASRLRADEQRFRLICGATNDALWDWDLVTNALWRSDDSDAVYGHASREVEAGIESWSSRIHPDDRDTVVGGIHEAIRRGDETWCAEYRFRRRDGAYVIVRDRGHVIRDHAGRPLRMVGGMSDVSDQRAAEGTLREQAVLLDAANDAIVVRDMKGVVTYWNPAAARMYGKPAAEVLGRPFCEVVQWTCEGVEEMERTVRASREWVGELTHVVDGHDVVVATRWSLVNGPDGEPRAILSIGSDVTSQRRLEAEARRSQRMDSIGTLASGIAHDLNNVLTPILLSLAALESDTIRAEDRREMLHGVSSSARRGAAMVRQLLAFARGVEGKRVVVRVTDVVAEVQRIARDALPACVELRATVPGGVPAILGDATQLQEVLLNLVLNARDAMPEGGRISVHVQGPDAEGPARVGGSPRVVIRVSDTGPGMARHVRERVFDPFFTTKEVGKGTGLGLSMAHALVKAHGGTLDVESEEGRGATFVVRLPAASDEDSGLARKTDDVLRGEGQLVLIVDDEEPIRMITRQTLIAFGYRVLTAANGAEAAALFARDAKAIDVVLTDMTMPVMDGPATIRALREIDPAARIVATSGFTTGAMGGAPHVEGADLFLPKPFAADDLLRALHEVLARATGGEPAAAPSRGAGAARLTIRSARPAGRRWSRSPRASRRSARGAPWRARPRPPPSPRSDRGAAGERRGGSSASPPDHPGARPPRRSPAAPCDGGCRRSR